MRLYLAGPMRGYPLFNFPAFDRAAADLRARGHHVFSPAERDRQAGFDETRDDIEGFDLHEAMRADFRAILDRDGIVLLDGWQQSSGARAERFVAEQTGRRVFTYSTLHGLVDADPWVHALVDA